MSTPSHIEALETLLSPNDEQRALLVVPGCWDGFSVLLIEQAGFSAAWVGADTLSLGRFGRPDVGLVTAGEMVQTVATLRDRTQMPLLVDGDGGFGNALNVVRTVKNLERAGASAILLSDQSFPKRLDDLAATPVISAADMIGKLKAALDSRRDVLVVARTSALTSEGVQAALDRAAAYMEMGVDLLLVDGAARLQDVDRIGRLMASGTPLVHCVEDSAESLTDDHAAMAKRGYAVVLHPKLLLQGLARAAPEWLRAIKAGHATNELEGQLLNASALDALTGAHDLSCTAGHYSG